MANQACLRSPPSLLDLPVDVRIKIYDFVFAGSTSFVQLVDRQYTRQGPKIHIRSADVGILLTCRRIYQEARYDWYASDVHLLGNQSTLRHLFYGSKTESQARIRKLTIQSQDIICFEDRIRWKLASGECQSTLKLLRSLEVLQIQCDIGPGISFHREWEAYHDMDDESVFDVLADEVLKYHSWSPDLSMLKKRKRDFDLAVAISVPPRKGISGRSFVINLDARSVERLPVENQVPKFPPGQDPDPVHVPDPIITQEYGVKKNVKASPMEVLEQSGAPESEAHRELDAMLDLSGRPYKCYSPTCTPYKLCYSRSCPRWSPQQTVPRTGPDPGERPEASRLRRLHLVTPSRPKYPPGHVRTVEDELEDQTGAARPSDEEDSSEAEDEEEDDRDEERNSDSDTNEEQTTSATCEKSGWQDVRRLVSEISPRSKSKTTSVCLDDEATAKVQVALQQTDSAMVVDAGSGNGVTVMQEYETSEKLMREVSTQTLSYAAVLRGRVEKLNPDGFAPLPSPYPKWAPLGSAFGHGASIFNHSEYNRVTSSAKFWSLNRPATSCAQRLSCDLITALLCSELPLLLTLCLYSLPFPVSFIPYSSPPQATHSSDARCPAHGSQPKAMLQDNHVEERSAEQPAAVTLTDQAPPPTRTHLTVPTSYRPRPSLDSTYSDLSELSIYSNELHHSHRPLIHNANIPSTAPARSNPTGWRLTVRHIWIRNKGAFLVLLSQAFGAGMNVSTRILETRGTHGPAMHPFQILFARQSVTSVASLAYGYLTHIHDFPFGPRNLVGLLVTRGLGGFFGVFGLYFSLLYLPLAEATVLTFLAPILTCYACSLFIPGETFSKQQQMASFLALVGVVFIARPASLFKGTGVAEHGVGGGGNNGTSSTESSRPFSDPPAPTPHQHLLAIGISMLGVVGGCGAMTSIRWIGTRAHPLISVNYFSIWCSIVSLVMVATVPSVEFRLPGNWQEWMLLASLGSCGFVMQYLLTAGLAYGGGEDTAVSADLEGNGGQRHDRIAKDEKDMKKGSGTRATNMVYTQMLFALTFDKWIWGITPGWASWVGSGIIVASAGWVAMARDAERQQTPSAGATGADSSGIGGGMFSSSKKRKGGVGTAEEEQGLMSRVGDDSGLGMEEGESSTPIEALELHDLQHRSGTEANGHVKQHQEQSQVEA